MDGKTGELVTGPLSGHLNGVVTVAFSPNGSLLVSGSEDGSIRIWDPFTGALIAGPLTGHRMTVKVVQFTQDGDRLISAAGDTSVRIWDIKRLPKLASRDIEVSGSEPAHAHPETDKRMFFRDTSVIDESGWLKGPDGELLLWAPPLHREGLWRPSNAMTIGQGSTKLDFSQFVAGETWAQCYDRTSK